MTPSERNEPMKLRKRQRVDYARLNGTELDYEENMQNEGVKHSKHKVRANRSKLDAVPVKTSPLAYHVPAVNTVLAYPIGNDKPLSVNSVPYPSCETNNVILPVPPTAVVPSKPFVSGFRSPLFPVPLVSSIPPPLIYPIPVVQCQVVPSAANTFTTSVKQELQ